MVKSGIYTLVWLNKYFYVGQTNSLSQRWASHKCAFRSGKMKRHHPKLFNVWAKYGEPLFLVLWECNIDDLNEIEQGFIDQYKNNPMLVNTNMNGRYDRGVDRRAKTPWQKGKKFTALHRKRLSEARQGKSGVQISNHKLTENQVREIKHRYSHQKKGSGSTALAKDYGVSYRTILYIVNGERYADV